jgi:hypothetical protein
MLWRDQKSQSRWIRIPLNCVQTGGSVFARLFAQQPKVAPSIARKTGRRGSQWRARSRAPRAYFPRLLREAFGLPTRPPIGQALSYDASHRFGHALSVIDTEFLAFVVAKIEFSRYRFRCCWLTWWNVP